MATRTLSHHRPQTALLADVWPPRSPLRFVKDRFLWLPIGVCLAIVWANLQPESYFSAMQWLQRPVNEIGMALFIALIAHDAAEALGPGGALNSWRHWSVPVVAGVGGMAGATLTFLAFVSIRHEAVLLTAWPVAAAVDVAAGYYLVKVIFRRSAALPFILVLGFASNAAGLLVVATWPALTSRHAAGAAFVIAAAIAAANLRWAGVRRLWIYFVLPGAIAWWGFRVAGVHPALALLPIVPFLPRHPRSLDVFAVAPGEDRLHREERHWNAATQAVLFAFGLANGGVLLRGYDTGSWAVLLAAFVGRPASILVSVLLAEAVGLRLPRRIGWRELTVIALASSSGFTCALWTATAVLPPGAVLLQIKVGALATAFGAVIAYGVARTLRVGRFAPLH